MGVYLLCFSLASYGKGKFLKAKGHELMDKQQGVVPCQASWYISTDNCTLCGRPMTLTVYITNVSQWSWGDVIQMYLTSGIIATKTTA